MHRGPQPGAGGLKGKMRSPSISVYGFLWVWLPLFYSRSVKIDKVIADTKSLTRTIVARIQEHQFPPLSLKINGLDFIPGELPVQSLEAMDEALELFHQVLSNLPLEAPVVQISHDVENLQSLLQLLGSHLGCPPHRPARSDALQNLTERLAVSPYTAAVVTLDRLQKCLQSITKHLDHVHNC
ncbi:leptin isoform X1 [Pantherophis guttatus]|uniref:Leptin n=1 Tax=Pantherophis guttatus TaxID=94885 RepID=A0A6P9CS53_PANGU|nr:leptin isoform X1 [Pantherophis guttatus]